MNPESGRGSPFRELSTELAERDPEEYKRALIERLNAETKITGSALKKLLDEGIFDDKTIILQPDTWISETRRRPGSEVIDIHFGTEPLSAEDKKSLIFLDHQVNETVYRLSHEISHIVSSDATRRTKKIGQFYTLLKQMRGAGNGLSALGGLDFYKKRGPAEQAKEDLVELVNMHLIDPEYLKSYLAFLSDPKLEAQRSAIGVSDIDAEVAGYIERIVANGVKERLGR